MRFGRIGKYKTGRGMRGHRTQCGGTREGSPEGRCQRGHQTIKTARDGQNKLGRSFPPKEQQVPCWIGQSLCLFPSLGSGIVLEF